MLTGDMKATADAFGRRLGIDEVVASSDGAFLGQRHHQYTALACGPNGTSTIRQAT
jgi:hypothetical protein